MKLAASNIAWPASDDAIAAETLRRHGFQGVEIAPTRVWENPLQAGAAAHAEHRRFWEKQNLPIVALQSLLFGHPELTLFDSPSARALTLAYLRDMIGLGRDLGAGVLIFGSPKNRKRGALKAEEAQRIAVDFFRTLGNHASAAGVCFCVEPNPAFYECDFVTTSSEGRALADAVGVSGFDLHLDAAAMTLAAEKPAALQAVAGRFRHFHASEKNLETIGAGSVDHAAFASALRQTAYPNWVSVEMRAPATGAIPRLDEACAQIRTVYG